MVTAAPVRRGSDVFDVVLQPRSETGTTNMVLWLGDLTTVWNLEVGLGPRTADVVFVVTQPRAAQPAAPSPTPTHSPRGATAATTAAPGSRTATPPPNPSSPSPGTTAPPVVSTPPGAPAPGAAGGPLELRQTVGPVTAVFRAFRTPSGIVLRYEITNGKDADLLIKPTAILVRADGHTIAYGMARDSVDRGRPDIIPRGATETGVIDLATPSTRRIELVLSLWPVPVASAPAPPGSTTQAGPDAPVARTGTAPSTPPPIVLQATFSGLDRLPVTPAP